MASAESFRGRDRQPSPLGSSRPGHRSESRRVSGRRCPGTTVARKRHHGPGALCTGDIVRIFSRSADAWIDGEVVEFVDEHYACVEYELAEGWHRKILHIHSEDFDPEMPGTGSQLSSGLSEDECDPQLAYGEPFPEATRGVPKIGADGTVEGWLGPLPSRHPSLEYKQAVREMWTLAEQGNTQYLDRLGTNLKHLKAGAFERVREPEIEYDPCAAGPLPPPLTEREREMAIARQKLCAYNQNCDAAYLRATNCMLSLAKKGRTEYVDSLGMNLKFLKDVAPEWSRNEVY
eukprot:gnl/TRDRNA2_/TRDRNA2_174035_c4_seq3.p1 gnl/TRDRNA2_/TRDRNA2_174035_c4~~gnl/TRDRNA2_/TRDRNA2_174035_c4_seq3.p1  ORF type:complete len:290 (-),score=15.90 gnl/TRDRNA2_/TRDRNA2_174035_c4_seq3:154-1023(-)